MNHFPDYWDALALHHTATENNYLDVPSLRPIIRDIRPPALVVGAGQGLIVEALLKRGIQTDGVDLSSEMIRQAKKRRGLILIEANAKALPFGEGTYETIIYATGVIDFISDEAQISMILNEAKRVMKQSGKIFVAFYKMSVASEAFTTKLGLLRNNVLSFRETLELYRMNPLQMIAWVAKKAEIDLFRATILSLRTWTLSTMKEKAVAFNLQKVFRKMGQANSVIDTAPQNQPYRNEPEIRNLFKRLAIPIKKLAASNSCYIVQI